LQNWVKQLVDPVIATEFQAPDLEFAWDQDRAVDPSEVAKIAASYVAAGIKSVNEVRAELGLAPVPGGETPQSPKAQGAGGKGPAADGSNLANADALFRFNPNHFGRASAAANSRRVVRTAVMSRCIRYDLLRMSRTVQMTDRLITKIPAIAKQKMAMAFQLLCRPFSPRQLIRRRYGRFCRACMRFSRMAVWIESCRIQILTWNA